MSENARRASAEISFNGADITGSIMPYLLQLTYTDNEEDETDDLQIKLQDRDNVWLKSWLGEALDAATSTAASNAPAASTTSSAPKYTVNAKSGLNVRSGPGTNYSKLGALVYGASVTVTGTSGSWSAINYNSKTAYVYSSYLTASDSSSHSTLRFGSYGSEVTQMQQKLISRGFSLPKYGADGSFGSETKSAVIAFQKANGLTADGICGPLTWAALDAAPAEDSGSTTPASKLVIQAVIARTDWPGTKSLDCGQFELDSVSASGPPSTVTIKATSLPYSSQIRQTKKSKAWEAYNLSGIAQEMASKNGMTCMYLSDTDPYYDRVEQYQTADIAFLSTLCHNAGLSLKATNNIIVLFDQAQYEAKASVITIDKDSGEYEKWKLDVGEADTQYASCRVSYTSPSGQHIEGIAKSEEYDEETAQQLEVYAKVTSIAQAQTLAAKYLRLHNKYAKSATLTLPGNPDLVAGLTVNLTGWGAFSGKYVIAQAKHALTASGYTTQIKLRAVIAEVPQAAAPAAAKKSFAVGDIVTFTGNRHYVASNSDNGYSTKGGQAKITIIASGAKHPYHLIHTGAGCTVYGWVNAGDIS